MQDPPKDTDPVKIRAETANKKDKSTTSKMSQKNSLIEIKTTLFNISNIRLLSLHNQFCAPISTKIKFTESKNLKTRVSNSNICGVLCWPKIKVHFQCD